MKTSAHIFILTSVLAALLLSCSDYRISDTLSSRVESYSRLKYKRPQMVIHDILSDADSASSQHPDYIDEIKLNAAAAYMLTLRYDSAESLLTSVIETTDNDLLRAAGDVDMMSLCLVTSRGKDFYDYRVDAQYRLDNVADYSDCMDTHLRWLYNTTLAKYHFVSLNYFMRLRQQHDAENEFAWIDTKIDTYSSDTTLYANYLLLHALSGMASQSNADTRANAIRQLVHLLYLSHQNGYAYYDIIASNALARYVAAGGDIKPSILVLVTELFGDSIASDLPTHLATHAASAAREYGNAYLESSALCTLSDISLSRGDNEGALSRALDAFSLLSAYNKSINKQVTDLPLSLAAFPAGADTSAVEMELIYHPLSITVPEWMAMVRQQLSIVYGAMGQKAASDYNHNIYFDILDATRQDLRAKQEQERLVAEENLLNILLLLSALVIVATIAILIIYNVKSRQRHRHKVRVLSRVIGLCQQMTNVALDADFSEDSADDMRSSVDSQVRELFPQLVGEDWTRASAEVLDGLWKEMFLMLQVFYRWMRQQGQVVTSYTNQCRQLEAETGSLEHKYHQYKRSYIKRATSVSIATAISPFLHRALHEADKLASTPGMPAGEMQARLQYLSELVEKIDSYNDILGHWVKISQGMVSLNVENVSLAQMFHLLRGSSRAFEMKGITLDILPTDLTVRCDRTMTLFMLNTLLDNARKYTPAGGRVTLSASAEGDMARIAVSDTGYGLSPSEVNTLNSQKVYDARDIGSGNANKDDIRENKGFGFGLMNCKHIIAKLQKSGSWARGSQFAVKSEAGKGSTFFITLPLARQRALTLIALILSLLPAWGAARGSGARPAEGGAPAAEADSLLGLASAYVDSVCSANISGDHTLAVSYAGEAVRLLNGAYRTYRPQGDELMTVRGPETAELSWWTQGLPFDYDDIISLRNEVAIAALSIPDRELYRHNSEAFSRLYTLTSTDYNLEDNCLSMQRANRYKKTILILLATFMLLGLATFFLLHYRHNLLFLFNLRQLLRLNSHVFAAPRSQMLATLRHDLSDIVSVESIAFKSMADTPQHSAASPQPSAGAVLFDGDASERSYMESLMQGAAAGAVAVEDSTRTYRAYPLVAHAKDGDSLTGVVGLKLASGNTSHEDDLVIDYVMQFLTIYNYFSNFKVQELEEQLDCIRDEHARTDVEQRRVYEHSQIVDNTLSVLKHETLYYPNRLRQLIAKVSGGADGEAAGQTLRDISETLSYYSQVFTTLHACASRQIDKSLFRRTTMTGQDMAALIQKVSMSALRRPLGPSSVEGLRGLSVAFTCDADYLQLLLETILPWLARQSQPSDIIVSAERQSDFVAFSFHVDGFQYSPQQLRQAFYVDGLRYDSWTDEFSGAELFTCREIIRIHDEHCGGRGCRVYIENEAVGSRFVFSLPARNAR